MKRRAALFFVGAVLSGVLFGLGPTWAASDPTAVQTSSSTVLMIFRNLFIPEIYLTVKPGLEAAGYEVKVASREMGLLDAKNSPLEVQPDLLLANVVVTDYVAIVFGCDNDLTTGTAYRDTDRIAQQAAVAGILQAGICTGPILMGHAGVLEGRNATAVVHICTKLGLTYGATCTRTRLEQDGKFITAEDRGVSRQFLAAILETLESDAQEPEPDTDDPGSDDGD
ncbi:DJ-1/PfpI family protein [Candidatus Bipolaricaulota bacterium]|nr:DJ-1/PfpI family protein [Candidatus Bipolaricaulota bacterium]